MIDIEIRNITKEFPATGRRGRSVRAVDDVSARVHKGEIFFLLGPSGCGKTTLLRMLAGFVRPTSGKLLFGDKDVTNLPPERRNLAMVFQNYALWPHMTVEGNVVFGPRTARWNATKRRAAVEKVLELVGMVDRRHHKPPQLSGGQQQRVALARALAVNPSCLLLDEPLSNLDARLRARMRSEIRSIVKDAGATAVYVTHDQEEALSMADRIAVMDAGRIAQIGPPAEVYLRPATRFVADFLGEANFLDAELVGREADQVVLRSGAGELRVRAEGDWPAGAALTCCVRPEHVAVAPADKMNGPNHLKARCLDTTYLGATRRCSLALPDGKKMQALLLGGEATFEPGQDVAVSFSPDRAVVLRK